MNKFIELTGVVDGKVRLFNVNNISAIHRHGGHSAVELVGVSEYRYVVKKSYEEVKAMLLGLDDKPKVDEKLQELGVAVLKEGKSITDIEKKSLVTYDTVKENFITYDIMKELYKKRSKVVELVESLNNHMHDNGYTTDASKIQLLKTAFSESDFNRLFELIAKYRVE